MNDDFSFTETSQMAYGTIEKQWQLEGNEGEFDYLQVRGDENGTEVFEFLADNTDVEYTQIQCGEDGVEGLNFISTAHTKSKDASGAHLSSGQLIYDYVIRNHIHNHPSGSLNRSDADIQAESNLNALYGGSNIIMYKIYAKGKGYKTYEGYRPPNYTLTK